MLCPKCSGKTRIVASYVNMNEEERYRHYSCKNENCNYKFYTVEFIVEETEDLKRQVINARRVR